MIRYKKIIGIIVFFLLAFVFGIFFNFFYNSFLFETYPQKYSKQVSEMSNKYDVPETIIYAVIKIESNFDPTAISSAGAIGLMQIMPSTFEWLTTDVLKENLPPESINNPDINIKYGVAMLSRLYKYYGNWETVFAAYNAGMGNVNKWLDDNTISDRYGNLKNIPFDETRKYVEKVTDAIKIYNKLYYK